MRIFAVTLSFLLVGCGSGLTTRGIAIRDMAPEEEAVIRSALAELGDLVDRPVTVRPKDLDPAFNAEAPIDSMNCAIFVRPGLSLEVLKTVIWHEYGHCAGLVHTADGNLMYRLSFPFKDYKPYQIEAFLTALREAIGGDRE